VRNYLKIELVSYQQLSQKAIKVFPLGIFPGIYTRNTGKTDFKILIYKHSHSYDQNDQIHVLHTKVELSVTYCYASLGELCWLHFIWHALNFEGHIGRKSIEIILSLKLH